MSKNVLETLEGNSTPFFVMKSFIYPVFETDRKKAEWHIFYIKPNSNPEAYYEGYMNLKMRKMNKKEIRYFLSNISEYVEDMKSEDGTVYNLKKKPFDRKMCPTYRQLMLSL